MLRAAISVRRLNWLALSVGECEKSSRSIN
jgi:hypothetical protein